jgi:hypothetical protein
MTHDEKQALEALALFAIQHVPCGLVEQTYRRTDGDGVTIHVRCQACGAATSGAVSVSALADQLRDSLRGTITPE